MHCYPYDYIIRRLGRSLIPYPCFPILVQERIVLAQLYYSTSLFSDPYWLLTDGDHCSYYGVECDSNTHMVTSLVLPGYGLTGQIPSTLDRLGSLEILDLKYNIFDGIISNDICNIRNGSVSISADAVNCPDLYDNLPRACCDQMYNNPTSSPTKAPTASPTRSPTASPTKSPPVSFEVTAGDAGGDAGGDGAARLGMYTFDKMYNGALAYTNGKYTVFYGGDEMGWQWSIGYNQAGNGPALSAIHDAQTFIKSFKFELVYPSFQVTARAVGGTLGGGAPRLGWYKFDKMYNGAAAYDNGSYYVFYNSGKSYTGDELGWQWVQRYNHVAGYGPVLSAVHDAQGCIRYKQFYIA